MNSAGVATFGLIASCLIVACGVAPNPESSAVPRQSISFEVLTVAASQPPPGIASFVPRELTTWRPNDFSRMLPGPIAYLSTDPLLPSCAVAPAASPNPPDSAGEACLWPLEALSEDGLFIELFSTRLLQPLPTAGLEIELNGAVTHLEISEARGCSEVGADQELRVAVPPDPGAFPRDESNLIIIGCARGPHLSELEQQFRDALTRWPFQ